MAEPKETPAEKALRQRIVGIIVSDECQKLNFMYKGVSIDGSTYFYIALSLTGPNFTGKAIRVKVVKQKEGVEASYNIQKNIIKVPENNYGVTASQKMAIVHEVTHAILDARGKKYAFPRLENEMLAYIAGAMYNVNCNSPVPVGTSGLYFEAHTVAMKIKANIDRFKYTDKYSLDYTDLKALKNAIKTHTVYSESMTDATATYDDDGVGL